MSRDTLSAGSDPEPDENMEHFRDKNVIVNPKGEISSETDNWPN